MKGILLEKSGGICGINHLVEMEFKSVGTKDLGEQETLTLRLQHGLRGGGREIYLLHA